MLTPVNLVVKGHRKYKESMLAVVHTKEQSNIN